jgi:hypothetical protein
MKNVILGGCPRCGCKAFENLSSYSHCVNCFYAEDYYQDLKQRVLIKLKKLKEKICLSWSEASEIQRRMDEEKAKNQTKHYLGRGF